MIRLIRALFRPAIDPEQVDPLTRARNENSAAMEVEGNTTRRAQIMAEQRALTTAALRRGV